MGPFKFYLLLFVKKKLYSFTTTLRMSDLSKISFTGNMVKQVLIAGELDFEKKTGKNRKNNGN